MADADILYDDMPPIPTDGGYGDHVPVLVPSEAASGPTALLMLAGYLRVLWRRHGSKNIKLYDELALRSAERVAIVRSHRVRWTPVCLEATRRSLRHHMMTQDASMSKIYRVEMLQFLLYSCAHLRFNANAHGRIAWEEWIDRTLEKGRGAGRRD